MEYEPPVLLPPDDLLLTSNAQDPIRLSDCDLLAHNVAPDGKANPIEWDDPHFIFLYRHNDSYFRVQGLNPEMMSGHEVPAVDARALLKTLPYRVDSARDA